MMFEQPFSDCAFFFVLIIKMIFLFDTVRIIVETKRQANFKDFKRFGAF
jgi:hypothetical protein